MSDPSTATNSQPQPQPQSAHTLPGKLFLFVTAAILLGWFVWLSYTALTKSKDESIVSRAQAAGATVPVVANLNAEPKSLAFVVKVVKPLTANGPKADEEIHVINLNDCKGYTGPGDYLLLLERSEVNGRRLYAVVSAQRSPADGGTSEPRIYKWNADVEAQVKRMFPQ